MNFNSDVLVESAIPNAGKDTVTHFANDQAIKCWLVSVLENNDGEFNEMERLKEHQRKVKIIMDSLCIFSDISSSSSYDEVAKSIIMTIHTDQDTMGSAVLDDCFDKLHFWKVEAVESNLVTISLIGDNDFEDETQSHFTARTRKAKTNIDFKQVGFLTVEGLDFVEPRIRDAIPAGYVAWKIDEDQVTRVEINPSSPRSEASSSKKKPTTAALTSPEQIAAMISKQVAEQVAKTLAALGQQPRSVADGTQSGQTLQQIDKSERAYDYVQLKVSSNLFFLNKGTPLRSHARK